MRLVSWPQDGRGLRFWFGRVAAVLTVVGCLADALDEVLIFRGTLGGDLQLTPHLLEQDQLMGPIAIDRAGSLSDRWSIVLTHVLCHRGLDYRAEPPDPWCENIRVPQTYTLAGYNPSLRNAVRTAS